MKLTLDLEKSFEQNAADYFEAAKKAKHKLAGAQEAYKKAQARAEQAKAAAERREEQAQLKEPEQHWYHKYRWSLSRNGGLIVAGQNASANEAIMKHQVLPEDIVFHTDMAGSPFTLLRGSQEPEDLEDAALITACYSKGWKKGVASVETFHVKPEQVTKEAQAGEYLGKGAFMIRGETTYHHPELELGIGIRQQEGRRKEVFVGSPEACKKHCLAYAVIRPGSEKASSVAKQISKKYGGRVDDYVRMLPAGGSTITSWRPEKWQNS